MPRFVVEWSDDCREVIRVWAWDDWLRTGVSSRSWTSAMVDARDELDAYKKAMTGAYDDEDIG